MTDHIKAARRIWGESAILPLADLERFYAIAYRAGMERAAEICDLDGQYRVATLIRAHAQNQPKPLHDDPLS